MSVQQIKIWGEGGIEENLPVLPSSFNVSIPEIYQIEATSACNYECGMCYRFFGDRQNENSYFPIDLAKKMVDRGDLEGSYFVEFQLSGEPLLHPRLGRLIDVIKQTGVMTGLSTNGSLLHPKSGKIAARNLEAVCKLDLMTVSVDGVDEEVYELYRPVVGSKKTGTQGPSFSFTSAELFEVIDLVLAQPVHPDLDLQIIELPGWEVQMEKLKALAVRRGWIDKVNLRTTPDSFILMRGEHALDEDRPVELCLNPWTSVTVLSSGKVVSCCYDFHRENDYGDLKEQSLAEIWQGKAVKQMQTQQAEAVITNTKSLLPSLCQRCYMQSPTNIHRKFFMNRQRGHGHVYLMPGREQQQHNLRKKE